MGCRQESGTARGWILILAVCCAGWADAAAGTLYSTNRDTVACFSNGAGRVLFTIDPVTALTTNVAMFSGSVSCNTSLTYDPTTGKLYGTNSSGSGAGNRIYEIDPATALTSNSVALNGSRTGVVAIAVDPTSGTMYGINLSGTGIGTGTVLYTIDKTTGQTVDVGPLHGDRTAASAIAFDPDGQLYAISGNNSQGAGNGLYTIDKSDATATDVGVLNGGRVAVAIAFDGDGALFAINHVGNGSGDTLFTIDPASAVATDVGPLAGSRNRSSSLAVIPTLPLVPALGPVGLVLLVLTLTLLLAFRKRLLGSTDG